MDLAIVCKSLRKLDITFHVDKVSIYNNTTDYKRKPETTIECSSLEEVYIDGIYVRSSLYDTIEP
jgi:hypothetical protein